MSSQVANTSSTFKYSKELLLILQHRVPKELDEKVIEHLRPYHLNKGNPFPDVEEVAKGHDVQGSLRKKARQTSTTQESNGQKTAPRLPLAPLNTNNSQIQAPVAKQQVAQTPHPKVAGNKENVAALHVDYNRKVASSAQKPLQTVKPSSKSVLSPSRQIPPIRQRPAQILLTPASPLPPSPASSPNPDVELTPSQMETDPHRLAQRQKQITYGYRTLGYLRYRLLVPRDKRRKEHPRTPRKAQICSKRSWDGQVKKWRRELHKWDPEPGSGFEELLTADILDSIFEGVPDIPDLIKGLKEKLAAGKIGEPEEEEELVTSPLPHTDDELASTFEASSVARALVF